MIYSKSCKIKNKKVGIPIYVVIKTYWKKNLQYNVTNLNIENQLKIYYCLYAYFSKVKSKIIDLRWLIVNMI